MNNKKGFTLVELLAIMVVLAMIALITIPIVVDVIEDSRRKTAELSANNYIKVLEQELYREQMNTGKTIVGRYSTNDGRTLINKDDPNITMTIKYNGPEVKAPNIVLYDDGSIYLNAITVDDYSIENYSYGDLKN